MLARYLVRLLGALFIGALVTPVSTAIAVPIIEVPAASLADQCEMGFGDIPADLVIACRGPDGTLFVAPELSYNEQGFLFQVKDTINDFCNRVSSVLPAAVMLAPSRAQARPAVTSDNLACR